MDVSTNGDHFFFATRGRRGVVVSGDGMGGEW